MLLIVLPFSRYSMNKIPCAFQNTSPADVCIFARFGRLSPAAVHSADSRFHTRVKWCIHDLSIVTYLRKNSLFIVTYLRKNCLVWFGLKQFQTTHWIVDALLFIKNNNFEQTRHPPWTQHSHWQMFKKNVQFSAFWYLQLCYLTQLQFTILQNDFVEFFSVFGLGSNFDTCFLKVRILWK